MEGHYITVTGVQLYRWYQMGITDPEDLCWLTEFYLKETHGVPSVMFSIQEVRRYMEKQC